MKERSLLQEELISLENMRGLIDKKEVENALGKICVIIEMQVGEGTNKIKDT